jgi:hypothetical protein
MKINVTEYTLSSQLEMTRVFYGALFLSLSTTVVTTILVFTSDFLARHGLILLLLPSAGFTLTLCAIIAGITLIFKREKGKSSLDYIVLFFAFLHIFFVGYILITLLT